MILLQTKKLENNLTISQLWTSTKAYMRYAFLLNFLMISIGCFATDAEKKYYKEDNFYKVYWATKFPTWNGINDVKRESIYAHEACTTTTLREYLNISQTHQFAIYEKDKNEQENANNVLPLMETYKISTYFSNHAVVKDNKSELKGKEVITPIGRVKFDELSEQTSSAKPQQSVNQAPIQNNNANDGNNRSDNSLEQTSSAKPQQNVNQAPIQNNNANDGNNQSQEQQSDLQQNGDTNNEGNKINYSVPMSLILVAIVCVASYRLFRSKKGRRE